MQKDKWVERRKSFDLIAANIISAFTNPFVVLFVGVSASNISRIASDQGAFWFLLAICFFPPLIAYASIVVRKSKGLFRSFTIGREEREPVFLVGVYSSIFATIAYQSAGEDYWMRFAMIITIFMAVIFLVTRYIDKPSVHAAAFSFAVMLMVDKIGTMFALLFFFLPVIYWARIKLHKHTWTQLMLGSVLGMVIGLLSWAF